MRQIIALTAILLYSAVHCQEKSWNWENDKPQEVSLEAEQNPEYVEDFQAAASEYTESNVQLNSTTADKVIDEILSSTRQGKALNGFDELYSDPSIQDVLQKGDEGEARNLIKDRLCYLGLMQCEDNIEGKRPYIAPEELVYAQPVAINPVGKPIPTIPVKGVRGGGGYGPPKPVPYPPSYSSGPPGKFGPPPSNKFGPPPSNKFGPPSSFSPPSNFGPINSGFSQNKPPRRHYGPPLSNKPSFVKPALTGEYYDSPEFLSKPPYPNGGDFIDSLPPYKFEQGAHQSAHHKDKRVEITVNAQGGAATASGGSTAGAPAVEHVHHHYHHNLEGANKPTVIVNPVPIAAAAVSTDLSSASNGFNTGFNPSAGLGGFSSSSGVLGSTIGGGGLSGGYYGGKPTVNYGSSAFGAIKPVSESDDSFGASVGSYGSSGLYKKELNLNSINNNYLQSGYADKYQGLESARAENYDCICVPYDQCPSHDVIGRKDDLYLPLDPRSLKSDIEAAPALSEEDRVITDGNGTMTVVRVVKDVGLNATQLEATEKKVSKREAPAVQKADSSEKTEGRQFYGGNGGRPQTCGPRHVCCRRPYRPNVPAPQVNRQCGTRHSQGINGRIKNPVYVDGDSEFGEYPWQVAILKKDPKESVYVCGGTLIDPLHIITAAHCVKTYTGFDLRVRLGEWDVNHDVEFYPYIERDIVSVHVHPEFYAGTLYNDIAILRMDKPVDFSKYPHISPACLPHPQDDYSGTRCWTTGWGKDAFGDFGKYQNILKEVDVPILNSGICQRQLQNTRLGYDFKLHSGFICAGGEEGKDACKGDGGGPMVCERGGTWQVVGIVSWGIGCGQVGVPGVYVKVAYYLDWIRQITQRY